MEREAMFQKIRDAMDPENWPKLTEEEELKAVEERYLKEHPPLKEEFITVTIPRPEGLEPEGTT